MARSRQRKADTPAPNLAELYDAIDRLTQHVQVLTNAVDELTCEVRNRQFDDPPVAPRRVVLKSMPLDPAAANWELNRVSADDLPVECADSSPSQRPLFT